MHWKDSREALDEYFLSVIRLSVGWLVGWLVNWLVG